MNNDRGIRIREERIRKGMTIPDLARVTKLSESTVGRIERGKRDGLAFLLEEHLGIATAEPRPDTDSEGPGDPGLSVAELRALVPKVLPYASDGRLIGEVADRFARSASAQRPDNPGPFGHWVWVEDEAPGANPTGDTTPDVADGNGPNQ